MLSLIDQAIAYSGCSRNIAQLFKRKWKSHLYGILPHPTEAKVLMLNEGNTWFLPHVCLNQDIYHNDIELIKETIGKELRISVNVLVNVLYYASYRYDKSKRQIHGVYVLEQDGSVTELDKGSWIDLDTLKGLSLKLAEHKPLIEKYLTEIESGNIPEIRPPWSRAGWFNCASQWIEQELSKLNYQRLSPPECIKSWGISCVLRVNTSEGNIYLKEASTLPLFCDEPLFTRELASLFPKHIPTVLSVNLESHWMLLADFGEPIGRGAPVKLF
ncbi:MAG: hypothetical protein AAF208_11320 [Cyanobacteria bacterium P01_A01_bin.45]